MTRARAMVAGKTTRMILSLNWRALKVLSVCECTVYVRQSILVAIAAIAGVQVLVRQKARIIISHRFMGCRWAVTHYSFIIALHDIYSCAWHCVSCSRMKRRLQNRGTKVTSNNEYVVKVDSNTILSRNLCHQVGGQWWGFFGMT